TQAGSQNPNDLSPGP
nr:RecName: Full=Unknown 70 kDa protein [Metarhizium anisopliae]